MKNSILILATSLASTAALASGSSDWGYAGAGAPEHWAKLSPEYSSCAGQNQSPVNLTGFVEADIKPVVFDYREGGKEVINNGHTIQVNYTPGSSIVVDGTTFNFLQFHFHAPSENRINGKSFPMEAHFVHADKRGKLAVVAVMFETGDENPVLGKVWQRMPEQAGDKQTLPSAIKVDKLLPTDRDVYRFNGSLTTPPCTEGVRWLVMKQPMTASAAQIKAFENIIQHPNNRPVQATNARLILK